jgi:hypothetical protein
MSIISGEKHEGNFLNKDDPKVATLLEQADLLSSLAAKIKTENTSQSMDEAWQVCEQELKCYKVLITCPGNTINNNQAFYSQSSWGRLEIKPHEVKNRDKIRVKKKGHENKGR